MQREHDEFLDGWLTGDALTALKTVRARVNSGVVISPELGKAILRAMDILAGDLITAVSDRERYNAEAHVLAVWLANRELGIPLKDQGCTVDGGMGGPDPHLLREDAARQAQESVGEKKEMEAHRDRH